MTRKRILLALLLLSSASILLAGVVGLTKFFRKRSSGSWRTASTTKPLLVDHICIDMNQLVHTSLRSKSNPTLTKCISKIYSELDGVLKFVTPRKSLVLVFDGPAPFAKIQTQRNRRMNKPENNVITPGTDFMALMETFMLGRYWHIVPMLYTLYCSIGLCMYGIYSSSL